MRSKSSSISPIVMALLVLVSGCDAPSQVQVFNKITDISAKPLEWEGRTVRLRGVVTNQLAVPFLDSAMYELRDQTGAMNIVSKGSLPSKGETITLIGKVKNAIVVGPFSGGLVVIETVRL